MVVNPWSTTRLVPARTGTLLYDESGVPIWYNLTVLFGKYCEHVPNHFREFERDQIRIRAPSPIPCLGHSRHAQEEDADDDLQEESPRPRRSQRLSRDSENSGGGSRLLAAIVRLAAGLAGPGHPEDRGFPRFARRARA